MPKNSELFLVGDRVKILESYYWAKGIYGTIKQPPTEFGQWLEDWTGCSKEEMSLRGLLTFFWVEFDKSQIDADGDGPYFAGAIDSEFLILMP